jgi:hypothetical protein
MNNKLIFLPGFSSVLKAQRETCAKAAKEMKEAINAIKLRHKEKGDESEKN